ncbi:hypothetical protein HPB50_017717 [Hyalomma asiaticum]|uniref:Uncharacterized protein n=1 Tax=Hyalomma asiaticum TaxID=266040 RepID=A0ACB7T927_HYAAI|nr:hypothetical protein HPB50_017717 [Hyalomma asiaticum]
MLVLDTHSIRITGSTRVKAFEAAEDMAVTLDILDGKGTDSLFISDAKAVMGKYLKGWLHRSGTCTEYQV